MKRVLIAALLALVPAAALAQGETPVAPAVPAETAPADPAPATEAPAEPEAPTDVRAAYMAACLQASRENTELCTCKTEQASQLVDEETMGFIAMALSDPAGFATLVNSGEVPQHVVDAWGPYVMKSNIACAEAGQ